ncbi:hypothetical protein ACOALA_13720 [Alicyclobacillus acidoterrestris]|uniref:hypothetical protein n=1 Tax=Alicyclobacillus acidoterrestris TaxID=1450 RepID=UPI003F53BEAE
MNITEAELEAVINRKVEERLAALRVSSSSTRLKTPWDDVKSAFESQISDVQIDSVDHYQLVNALSTILRHGLGIRMVRFLTDKQKPIAMELADTIARFVTDNRQSES